MLACLFSNLSQFLGKCHLSCLEIILACYEVMHLQKIRLFCQFKVYYDLHVAPSKYMHLFHFVLTTVWHSQPCTCGSTEVSYIVISIIITIIIINSNNFG